MIENSFFVPSHSFPLSFVHNNLTHNNLDRCTVDYSAPFPEKYQFLFFHNDMANCDKLLKARQIAVSDKQKNR